MITVSAIPKLLPEQDQVQEDSSGIAIQFSGVTNNKVNTRRFCNYTPGFAGFGTFSYYKSCQGSAVKQTNIEGGD